LMRGRVSAEQQKASVMAATEGIEGIADVVDEIAIATAEVAETEAAETQPAPAAAGEQGFSFREALAAEAAKRHQPLAPMMATAPSIATNRGQVVPAAANETELPNEVTDRDITAAVVGALGKAQRSGQLRGFGVDVSTEAGDVWLTGRASHQQHKQLIMELAQRVPGVNNVIDDIQVYAPKRSEATPASAENGMTNLQPVAVEPAARPVSNLVDQGPVAAAAPYRMPQAGSQPYAPAGHVQPTAGMGMGMGQPVPAAYGGGRGAPRYDQPYMPNHAWPGYAAYPNYAAVTYPQQYSPSAWPYIGPFYPYPQVPLGWRKVSLEWDDGWWFLDFTDR